MVNFTLPWDNSFIGEIFPQHSIKGTPKIIQLFCYTVYLQKHHQDFEIIEKLKLFFGFLTRPYHTCKYKKKLFILYPFNPSFESEISITKINKKNMTLNFRNEALFLWLVGITSKIIKSNNEFYTFKYSKIKYGNCDFTKTTFKKCFSSRDEFDESLNIFKSKIDALKDLLIDNNFLLSSILSKLNSV